MTLEELESRINELRTAPIVLLCRTHSGRERTMTLRECIRRDRRKVCVNDAK